VRLLVLATTTLALVAIAICATAAVGEIDPGTIRACILAAAAAYHEPPAVLLILLNVEGGTLGAVSHNTNGTVDIGPMQVNQIWIPQIATHWGATQQATFLALRDIFCANIEAGAWILRQGLDEARGDFWQGVGYYHSHDPGYKRAYLQSVLAQALRLESLAGRRGASKAVSTPERASLASPKSKG
jgi:hypothetical protein